MAFEQHKENLSHMFQQYQRQESSVSLGTVRTISGVSQSSETMECVNGPSAEETAPSTVIELTVDESSQKSPDSASSSTITSSPQDTADERGPTSISVSNILARAEKDEQKLVEDSSTDGSSLKKETESTETQKPDGKEESEETNKQEPVTETSVEKDSDNLPRSVSDQAETFETKAVEVVKDSATTSVSDDAQTSTDDDRKHSNEGESSNSMTEGSLNEPDTDLPSASDQKDKTDQMSPETAACLDNSVLGEESVFNEDLVHMSSVSNQIQPSDADSKEESSAASAAAGDEGEVVRKEEDKHEDEDMKNKTEEKQVSGMESDTSETAEQNVTESAKDGQSLSTSESATADQQLTDTTLPSTAQDVAAAEDSVSPSHPPEARGTTGDTITSIAPEGSTSASSSDTQKSSDSVSKTKEIKIARLDVSNVALDTERLELKETTIVCILFLFSPLFNPKNSLNCVSFTYIDRFDSSLQTL